MTPITLGTSTNQTVLNLDTVWFIRIRAASATIYFHHRCPELVIEDASEITALKAKINGLEFPVPPGGGGP